MAAMAEEAVCASKDAQEAGGVKLRKPALKLMIALSAALALAACESAPNKRSSEYFPESKYGVKASPRVVADGKPVPKGGGRAIVGKPYKVAGRWYYPKEVPGYTKVGFASWYGEAFHGRKTANGEIYDRHSLTAAHTTMPLPSYARVTNVENGRSMIVRVNDRGPFHGNREIDLSQRVAKMLGTKQSGIGKVKVEYIGPARMDGKDEEFLLASYDGPGAVTPGGTMPGTMLAEAPAAAPAAPAANVMVASAEPLAQGAGSMNYVPSFAPRPRPLTLPQPVTVASTSGTTHPQLDPSYMVAFDPAVAYESSAQIMVASASPAVQATAASAAASEAQAILAPAAVTGTEVPAATPAVQTLGSQPQTLGTIRVPSSSPASASPAAYQDPAAAQPQLIWQPGLKAPRNLLRGGAVSSYAANDRINEVFGAFETFEGSATPLQKLSR